MQCFKLITAWGILFSFSSCTFHRLDIQTQYLTPDYLASFHIGSPDPHLYDPLLGQRLLIQWSLSSEEVRDNDLSLFLKVRFRNHQEQEVVVPIRSKRGTYLFRVNSALYCQTRGILTYYGEIRSPSSVFAEWVHPLWTPLIRFNFPAND